MRVLPQFSASVAWGGDHRFGAELCFLGIYIGGLSSKIDKFLAVQSQFVSDHGIDFYAPKCCQSATFVRTLFAFYCSLFFTKK